MEDPMTVSTTPVATTAIAGQKDQFLRTFANEVGTTLKVLRAYPPDMAGLQPHAKCKTARDLAWVFAVEQTLSLKALTEGFDWSKPGSMPPAPATIDEAIAAFESSAKSVHAQVSAMTDAELSATVQFPAGPGQMQDWKKIDFLWFLLHDQIHHRGQFSVYLRMAGGKVPSIYGPTADEPWF
jgi:uncharacterized damage-inducible protein DinB